MNIAIIMTVVLCIIVLQNEVNNEKILLCLTITLLMLNCGCGCHSIQGTDASNNQFCDEQFFDAEMANKPTTAEIERITQGMAFYDVVKIIGKPHGCADYDLPTGYSYERDVFRWETQDGIIYYIQFFPAEIVQNAEGMLLSEYHRYTVVVGTPWTMMDTVE